MYNRVIFVLFIITAVHHGVHAWTDECGVSQFDDAGVPPLAASMIMTGWEVRFNELPYQVLIENKTGAVTADPICGAVMINGLWVLTSASCVQDLSLEDMQVVFGEHRRQSSNPFRETVSAVEVHVHPGYTPNSEVGRVEYNDVALLRMERLIASTITHYPICAPPTVPFNHTDGIICGWGSNDGIDGRPTNELRCTYLDFLQKDTCVQAYPDDPLDDGMFCTFTTGRDVCTIDRGGPISVKIDGLFYVLGIASWSPGCSQGPPSVYMDVTYYKDWVDGVITSEN